jgi:hypothetical protein
MQELPDELGLLRNLQHLTLNTCQLASLPDAVSQLTAVTTLRVLDCRKLGSLPGQLGQLQQLKDLSISGSVQLKYLPESVGQLKALRCLDLERCSRLISLPESIIQCQQLRVLDLTDCGSLVQLPEKLGQLHKLDRLSCRNCSSLKALPDSVLQLHALVWVELVGCLSLPQPLPDASWPAKQQLQHVIQLQDKHKAATAAPCARLKVEPHQTASTNRRVTVVYGAFLVVCGLLSMATYTGLCQGLIVSANHDTSAVQQSSSLEYAFRFCNGVSFVASLCCIMVSLVAIMSLNYMPLLPCDPYDEEAQVEFVRKHGATGELLSAKGNSWLNRLFEWSVASFMVSMLAVCAAGVLAGLRLMGVQGLGIATVAVSGVLFAAVCTLLWLRRRFQDMFDAPTPASAKSAMTADEETRLLSGSSSSQGHGASCGHEGQPVDELPALQLDLDVDQIPL